MNGIISLIRQGFSHELISGSFLVFVGTTFSSFLAFLLNLFFARNMSYADYGVYASLLSIFSLAVIPGQSLNAIVVRFASQFNSLNETEKLNNLYRKTFLFILVGGGFLVLFSFIFSSYVLGFLKINDKMLLVMVAVIVAFSYLLTLNISFLNSLLKFKAISNSYSISAVFKLVAGIVLVYLGFRVYGALGAILLLTLVQFLITLYPIRKVVTGETRDAPLPLYEILRYAIPASIAILSLFSFVSSDVLLVKHFFNADQAGFYGGLSLVGKVIFYFTLPIPAVMFPLLVKRHSKGEGYSRLLYLTLLIVTFPSILITVFYYLFPEFTLKLFLGGGEYLRLAPYLGLYGIFLTIYSINNTFVTYFLSIKKTNIAVIVFIAAFAQLLLIYIYHSSFEQIIYVSIASSLLLLSSLVLYYLKDNGVIKT